MSFRRPHDETDALIKHQLAIAEDKTPSTMLIKQDPDKPQIIVHPTKNVLFVMYAFQFQVSSLFVF